MQSIECSHVCNKLKKWMNNHFANKSIQSNSYQNCNGKHHQNEISVLSFNKQIPYFPYETTSFENVLRKYPKNQEILKNVKKSQIQENRANQNKYYKSNKQNSFKRSYENHISNYEHIKSRIDSNLNRIKVQQKNLSKKIKLNETNSQSLNKDKNIIYQKRKPIKTNDENNPLFDNITENSSNDKQQNKKGRIFFKINLNKKINNKFRQNCRVISNQDQEQNPLSSIKKLEVDDQLESYLQQNEYKYSDNNQYQNAQNCIQSKLQDGNLMEKKQVLLFKNLKVQKQDQKDQQQENGIFGFDGYKIIEFQEQEKEQIEEQQDGTIFLQSNKENIHQQQYSQIPHQRNQNYETMRALQKIVYQKQTLVLNHDKGLVQQVQKTQQIQHEFQQLVQETLHDIKNQQNVQIIETKVLKQETENGQGLQYAGDLLQYQSKIKGQSPLQKRQELYGPILQILNQQSQVWQQELQAQNKKPSFKQINENDKIQIEITKNVQFVETNNLRILDQLLLQQKQQQSQGKNQIYQQKNITNLQYNFKKQSTQILTTQQNRYKKQKTEKQNKTQTIKILTRSQQEDLHLYNKLSLRLLRKKYGFSLSHQQLVNNILQSNINLKAFINNRYNKDGKIQVFDSEKLSKEQIKTVLLKYFNEQDNLA